MKRRDFIMNSTAMGVVLASTVDAGKRHSQNPSIDAKTLASTSGNKLTPPEKGKIPVAVAISQGVTVIDFAGPWEVFQDVMIHSRGTTMTEQHPFQFFELFGQE